MRRTAPVKPSARASLNVWPGRTISPVRQCHAIRAHLLAPDCNNVGNNPMCYIKSTAMPASVNYCTISALRAGICSCLSSNLHVAHTVRAAYAAPVPQFATDYSGTAFACAFVLLLRQDTTSLGSSSICRRAAITRRASRCVKPTPHAPPGPSSVCHCIFQSFTQHCQRRWPPTATSSTR